MPKSFRIKTEIGVNKVIPVNLDQQFDTLEILSLAIFPNDIYIRNCADFGVLCGRVFANRGFGIPNVRVSVFIPLENVDENNPVISTLYPYKRVEDFNEDGYKYNLLPYTQSHSGHVPVGSFPDRLDALTNKSVIEVYDKYYKYTTKTNDSGDYMIFGLPIGQHSIFMQVDLSDIGEFSLTPQDLIRIGLATETQIDGVKFKFSENYSELPQIVTLQRSVQVAPFYGEKDVCNHYIVRSDFDLTSEAGVELKPTSVFMGSIISHNNRKKLKKRCKVPAKAGWLCEMITGPGQIEAIRQTIFKDSNGNPILEEFTLENSGKVIDENGTWILEVPMNLDYVYTNEDGKKVLSDNPDLGVPTKGKYRFKVKWNQSPKVGEENKRGYFLVPNVKEWGWENSDSENVGSPTSTNWNQTTPTKIQLKSSFDSSNGVISLEDGLVHTDLPNNLFGSSAGEPIFGIAFSSLVNVEFFKVFVENADGNFVENTDYQSLIPVYLYSSGQIQIRYKPIDVNSLSSFNFRVLVEGPFKQECSYTFSLNWTDYGTEEMINEAINCEDRFYQMSYNKVYTVSQLIDRFAWQTFPQKAIEVKHITETKCEGNYNPFPANDVYYRYDIIFIILSFAMNFIVMPILICVIIIYHVLAWLYDIFTKLYPVLCDIRKFLNKLKCRLNSFNIGNWYPFSWVSCDPGFTCAPMEPNPFKNLRLGVFLYTDDGCERCRCNIESNNFPPGEISIELANYNNQLGNTSSTPDFLTTGTYQLPTLVDFEPSYESPGFEIESSGDFYRFIPQIMAGGSGNAYDYDMPEESKPFTYLLPFATDAMYRKNVLQFSPNLTLGERLNLFNTKAKYFDGADNNQMSPGNVGWNQIKVTWWPELNAASPVAPTTNVDGAYTTKINNENVWVIEGNQLSLLNQTIYIWNNSSSLQQIVPTNEYYEIVVTSTEYVQNIIGGQTYDYTILEFSSVTTNEIFSAPVVRDDFQWCNPANSFCRTPPYYDIDNDASYDDGFPGLTWDLFNMFPSELIGTTAAAGYNGGSPYLTTLIGSTIWIRKATTSVFRYYVEGNTSTLFDLSNTQDTEFKVEEIIKYEFGSGADPVFRAKLSDPITGQILIPYEAFRRFQVRKNNGVKFSWSLEEPPSIYDTFHLDNVLVLLVENSDVKQGDLLTFQDIGLSQDPNVGKPVGALQPITAPNNSIIVKYCDPNYPVNGGNLTTEYIAPVLGKVDWVTPFPRDVEYFQAVDIIPFSAMTTNRAPLNVTGNNRFSLPWRFLDSSNGKSVKRESWQQAFDWGYNVQPLQGTAYCKSSPGTYNNPYVDGAFAQATESVYNYGTLGFSLIGPAQQKTLRMYPLWGTTNLDYNVPFYFVNNYRGVYEYSGQGATYTNDFRVYRHQYANLTNNNEAESYIGMRGYNGLLGEGVVVQYSPFTRAFQMASPPNCGDLNDSLIGGTTDIWSTVDTSQYKIVFLQRGVDPHSRKIPVRYDLSRLYGYENYDVNANLYNTTTNTFGFPYIVEGEFYMNIPIQGRNNSTQNPNDFDMNGLSLPKHTNFNTNSQSIQGQRLFFPSYIYKDNVDSYSGNWETNLHTYYSALDDGAVTYQNEWTAGLVPLSTLTNYIEEDAQFSTVDLNIGLINNEGNNLFGYTPELEQSQYTIVNQGYAAQSAGYNFNGQTMYSPCQKRLTCTDSTDYGEYGLGYEYNHYADIPPLKMFANNVKNNVSGYWLGEYVEGASLMGCRYSQRGNITGGKVGGMKYYFTFTDTPQSLTSINPYYGFTMTEFAFGVQPPSPPNTPNTVPEGTCNNCTIYSYSIGGDNLNEFEYFSPSYKTVPFTTNMASDWANPNHTISMISSNNIVFRTDRLPTSTSVTQFGNNGLLMHQNPTFAIFIIDNEGSSVQEGGYALPNQAQAAEIDFAELPPDNLSILESLVDCTKAVNLNSYGTDIDGTPYIRANDPFSIKEGETYFVRGMGCYNFVSVPFKSLGGAPDINNGGGGDIASAVEWTRRTVLNFSLCFEIWSHTFSNNWVNGTLYHFPFQLNTFFDSNNLPYRDFCRHVVYFHEPNQTFYYRSSPYNGTDFIGKTNIGRMLTDGNEKRYGNDKQLMYPTTILDMGPKTNYLQELAYSDEYDGYIVSKIPPTTFQNVNDLLNIFVLSRLVNTNFRQQLIPTNGGGNNEGADDPSVKGFFANTRWANGEAFFENLLPSIVDADYAQILSINSEFGVKEYGPEVYLNTDIYFINDNNGNSVMGITMKSDNQERDYISPRRTIWNDNAAVPPPDGDFTYIPIVSQKVPDYQWRLRFQFDNTANDPLQYSSIFGMQSNDFWTNAPDPAANDTTSTSTFDGFFWNHYQKLDRFNDDSEYFKTDISNITKYYKAHIINYTPELDAAGLPVVDDIGNVSYSATSKAPIVDNRRYAYTFGAPFHFYFGLIQGASAMDRFRTKYVDTNLIYD